MKRAILPYNKLLLIDMRKSHVRADADVWNKLLDFGCLGFASLLLFICEYGKLTYLVLHV